MIKISFTRSGFSGRRRQHGIALILVTVAAVAIIGMAGLALDMGFVFINKSRLQNAADAAALSGARVLQQGLGTAAARLAATTEFNSNFPDYAGVTLLSIQTSDRLFDPALTTPPRFIRVTATAYPVAIRLARVIPGVGDSLSIGGSAVAGPLPLGEICGVVPIVLCAKDPGADTDCSDGNCYGYNVGSNAEITLAGCSPKGKEEGCGDSLPIGSGNYGFLDLAGKGGGADELREGLAGADENCLSLDDETVPTKTGKQPEPVDNGINTRFGLYNGNMNGKQAQYPPDVVTAPAPSAGPSMLYSDYTACLANPLCRSANGVPNRRVVAVPMADCSKLVSGSKPANLLGVACFFLTKPASGGDIYGQLVTTCEASGSIGPGIPAAGGPEKIVLYKDPANTKS